MPGTIIESVLIGELDSPLLLKLLNSESLEGIPDDCVLQCCNKNDFVACFLSFLRSQTDGILQTNSNAVQLLQHGTPEKLLSTQHKHCRSISDPTSADRTIDNVNAKTDRHRSHESPSIDKKRTSRRVKIKLFSDDKNTFVQSASSDESRLSVGVDSTLSSTPIKNGVKPTEFPYMSLVSPVTPKFFKENYERCDTPRLPHRYPRSQEKNCLGDFIVNVQKSSKKKRSSRNSIDNDECTPQLDLSNNEAFPEIGARKSSSLHSEKRRIKPTNIDKSQKSISLNSFSECIQTSPLLVEENSAFKQLKVQLKESANSFEVERNMLKQERHKLMEKFNIFNISSPQTKPQIKITQKETIKKYQNFIKGDCKKVLFKEKIDLLVDIYEILLNNNLVLSVNTEIYFLISILISKQYEDDCILAENKLNENDLNYLLKTIHNSTYFAVKSLWHQRMILEIILDKTSLKTLGENKKVRSFYPELAKFLLNCYGLRCEAETTQDRSKQTEARSNGVICFNLETDNVENFPSMLSFQNFKKQRDMLYEILRWYQEMQRSGGSRSTLRNRVKALLGCGPQPTNHAHLSALLMHHMLAHCLPQGAQESKLSKLQRRLTGPTAAESHRLPHFTSSEVFYKEFIMNAEYDSFRAHLRDTVACEIVSLDATQIALDDRGSSNLDISKEFLKLSKKLALLAKFLGFVTALPYCQATSEVNKTSVVNRCGEREPSYSAPKEKVLENNIALRNYSQPTIDLKGILNNAFKTGRLSITVPWIVHYLSMLDYTTIRIKYYKTLIKILISIYTNELKLIDTRFKKNTVIYLKSILGWLFDLPHFPQELFYENNRLENPINSDVTIDSCDLVDESIIIELCPYLRDLNVLLATCRVAQDQKQMGSYRHITPVSLTLNPEDRIKNKEKELQARLEDELLKSQPSSTRRVLELVIERITSAVVRELTATALVEARECAREQVRQHIRSRYGEDQASLLQSVHTIYSEHLEQLRATALEVGRTSIQSRAEGGVTSLINSASPQLVALAARNAFNRLGKWLNDNWSNTAILCKDIEGEMKTFIGLGDHSASAALKQVVDVSAITSPAAVFEANHVSPSACIINLKEQVCVLLDGAEPVGLSAVLAACARSCSPHNLFCRPPTQRAVMQLTVDLCVVFVSRKPDEINDTFLSKLHAVWNTCCPDRKRSPPQELTLPERREDLSPTFRNFEDERAPTPVSDEENNQQIIIEQFVNLNQNSKNHELNNEELNSTHNTSSSRTAQNQEPIVYSVTKQECENQGNGTDRQCSDVNIALKDDNNPLLEFFDRILCPRNIMVLSNSECVASDVWEAMATVLLFLLRNDYLNEDSLTEQCLAVYRQDWPQNILKNLSMCMKSVSARWSRSSTGKFTLFLDFLAEYCGDMDYEPTET